MRDKAPPLAETFPGVAAHIGPQRTEEPLFARRLRFHQSWYRSEVLGLKAFGTTSGKAPRPLGSILTEADALVGHNFINWSARELYLTRRASGWGVDPVRCTRYLTSSQALTLNLFGVLALSPQWTLDVLQSALDRTDFVKLLRLDVEFAPRRRSEHLHDMTRVDVLVEVLTGAGREFFGVEVKYADRFNSRRVDVSREPYRALAAKSGLWLDADSTLRDQRVNQLVRCHALVTSLAWRASARESTPSMLVLHHEADRRAEATVRLYQSQVTASDAVRSASLSGFIRTMVDRARNDEQRRAAQDLHLRYAGEEASERLWRATRAAN